MWSIIYNRQYTEKRSRRIMAGICSLSPANRLVARVRKVEQYRKQQSNNRKKMSTEGIIKKGEDIKNKKFIST